MTEIRHATPMSCRVARQQQKEGPESGGPFYGLHQGRGLPTKLVFKEDAKEAAQVTKAEKVGEVLGAPRKAHYKWKR